MAIRFHDETSRCFPSAIQREAEVVSIPPVLGISTFRKVQHQLCVYVILGNAVLRFSSLLACKDANMSVHGQVAHSRHLVVTTLLHSLVINC